MYTGTVPGAGTDANMSVVAVTGGGGQGLYIHCIYWDCTLGSCGGGGVVDRVCTVTVYTGPGLYSHCIYWDCTLGCCGGGLSLYSHCIYWDCTLGSCGGGGVVDQVCTATVYTGIVPWAVVVVVAMVDKSVADTDGGGGGVVDKVCTVTMCADANIALVVMLTVVVVVGGYGQGLYVY